LKSKRPNFMRGEPPSWTRGWHRQNHASGGGKVHNHLRTHVLTPKIGTWRKWHVGRNWQESTIRQELPSTHSVRSVCDRECIIIRQKNCSTFEGGNVQECVMTWTGCEERDKLMMDTKPTWRHVVSFRQ
jgi:hypothetical protein